MTDEIRFPYENLKKAAYDRIKLCNPTLAVYSIVPESDPSNPTKQVSFPYVVLGEFRGTPERTSKEVTRDWSVSLKVNLWSETTGTSEMDGMIAGVLGALSRTPLTMEGDWDVYSFEVESCDIYEVIFEEYGPLLHGVITARFKIEDTR